MSEISVLELETTACPLCQKDDAGLLYEINGFRGDERKFKIVKCLQCSFIYTNPRYKKEENNAIYGEDYFVESLVDLSGKIRNCMDDKERKFQDHRIEIKFLEKYQSSGKILEFGSGLGFFVQAMGKKWERHAQDISGFPLKQIIDPNISTHLGELKELKFEGNSFDVIYSGFSLDRIIDIHETLLEFHRILKKKGYVLITVPNINSIAARVFKGKFRLLHSNHLSYFSPKTLTAFLENANFEVVDIKYPFLRTSVFSWKSIWKDSMIVFLQSCLNLFRLPVYFTPPPFYGTLMTVIAVRK